MSKLFYSSIIPPPFQISLTSFIKISIKFNLFICIIFSFHNLIESLKNSKGFIKIGFSSKSRKIFTIQNKNCMSTYSCGTIKIPLLLSQQSYRNYGETNSVISVSSKLIYFTTYANCMVLPSVIYKINSHIVITVYCNKQSVYSNNEWL